MNIRKYMSLAVALGYTIFANAGSPISVWQGFIGELIEHGDATSEREKEAAVQAWRNIPGTDATITRSVDRTKKEINAKWPNAIPANLKRYDEMTQAEVQEETKGVLKKYMEGSGSFLARLYGSANSGVVTMQKGLKDLK